MPELTLSKLDGSNYLMTSSDFEVFRSSLQGDVLFAADPGYDEARAIHNGMIDHRPAMIVKCGGRADAAATVSYCGSNNLLLSVHCGGHSVAGFSVCEGGVMIDLTPMNQVDVDPSNRTANVGGGANWEDIDKATQAHGLATTGGIAPTTGVGGYTLGGGHGYLMRQHGLACDNLLSAEVVTADGQVLAAGPTENQELFWGLRGGGGNFGVVTSFEFQLYRLEQILGGLLIYPLDVAKDVLRVYRDVAAGAPEELGSVFALATHPEAGQVVGVIVCYSGAIEEGERLLRPLREFKPIIVDQVAPCEYAVVQGLAGDFNPRGMRHYWKSNSLRDLSDKLIDLVVDRYRSVPAPHTHVAFEHLGGAVARVPNNATACHDRHWPFDFLIVGMWDDPVDDDLNIDWVRSLSERPQTLCGRRRIHQLHGRRQGRGRRRPTAPNGLRGSNLRPPSRTQETVRSIEPVSPESKHPTRVAPTRLQASHPRRLTVGPPDPRLTSADRTLALFSASARKD